ncbi:uncharacterized protein LOC117326836 [Pecten maximus]|uniref:uncharacterized protein LOC117326836 n=1 Tax=Pecten maximus TaxID=6579 RepID=UPI0014590F6B|nr:uncharacterized protein LOC117326836 [Pecten maximus]
MSADNVIVAVCSVGAGAMGLIAGLLIMFVYKNCQTKGDTTDAEIGPPLPPDPRPREYYYRDEGFNTRPLEKMVPTSPPITCDGESGVYCRISKFDIPVVTEDAANQTESEGADNVYLVKFEQAVQCDIIGTCSPPSSDPTMTSMDHKGTMSYSAYRRHVRDAFSTLQVLSTATLIDHTGTLARQNEIADNNDVLVLKLTADLRSFLHTNGLCEAMSPESTPVNTLQTADGNSRPVRQTHVPLQTPSRGNNSNKDCGSASMASESGSVLIADDLYMNNDAYLPMDGKQEEDYLPMANLSENDDYLPICVENNLSGNGDDNKPLHQDNYSYLLSLQQKQDSTKPNIECDKTSPNTDNKQLPVAHDASGRCMDGLDGQIADTYNEASDNEYDTIDCGSQDESQDEDYLSMTTKTAVKHEDYYNCNDLKKNDDDDYLPVNEHTLPRRCGSSSHNPDYANYLPKGRQSPQC